MLHIVESRKPLDRVAKDLEDAVARHHFGVLGVHDLKAAMAKKGVDFGPECRVFEVCNPHQAKKVLEANLEISTALPCRISLYEEGRGPQAGDDQAYDADRPVLHARSQGRGLGGGGDARGHHGGGGSLAHGFFFGVPRDFPQMKRARGVIRRGGVTTARTV